MGRKTFQELNEIKSKYNVNVLWSWSKYNTYKTDKYEYFLKYILKQKEDRTNGIYSVSGGYAHQIVEDFYEGKIQYEEMIDKYEDYLLTMNMAELKYNRSDADKNDLIAIKYEACIKHFFKNHNVIKFPHKIEHFIIIDIDGNIFQGYIDFIHIEKYTDENGNERKRVVVTDWKTSSIYKGKKIEKECGQLLIYSEGIRQSLNIPLDDIVARWNFLKYVTVQCLQANGKWKERHIERNSIGESLVSSIKMWLKKSDYDEESIQQLISEVILKNDITVLPKEIQEKFIISDCYVNIPITEESIQELKDDIAHVIKEIDEKTKEYAMKKDDNIFWQEVTDEDSFRLATLSGYSRKYHKPYDQYLQNLEMFHNKDNEENEDDAEDLLDFLNNL